MAPVAAECCFSGVARQFAQTLEAVVSFAALTRFYLQVLPVVPAAEATS
jgi:hypothetical protein